MAVSTKAGAFNTSTAAAGNTVIVTGLGFQPKALILWWSKVTGSVDAVSGGHVHQGIGFATSSTNRNAAGMQSEDASASSDTDDVFYSDACIVTQTISGATDGLMDVQSFDSDGFTLVIDDAFAADYRISYWAIGGSDITSVYTGTQAVPAGTGNESITAPGFQPDITFFWLISSSPSGTTSSSGTLGIGAAISSSSRRTAFSAMPHGQVTMLAYNYSYDGECLSNGGTSATATVSARADFVSHDANGFTVNWLEVGGGRTYGYLCIAGGQWVIGDLLTQTDTSTDITESGFGFAPTGAFFISHCNTKSTQDTIQNHASLSMGAMDSTSSRSAQSAYMENGTADSETTFAVEHDQVYINISTADAVQGLMDIKSVDSDGFTCIMDDADPSQNYVWYVAVGSEAGGGGGDTFFENHHPIEQGMKAWNAAGMGGVLIE